MAHSRGGELTISHLTLPAIGQIRPYFSYESAIALDPEDPIRFPWDPPRGNESITLSVNLTQFAGVREEELWNFVRVGVTPRDIDRNPLLIDFGTVSELEVTSNGLRYNVKFPCVPEAQRPYSVEFRVEVCGDSKTRETLIGIGCDRP